jgi:sortase (surface protein transpeptidase)
MPHHPLLTRRTALAAFAAAAASRIGSVSIQPAQAQESTPAAPVLQESPAIVSTGRGEVPSFGVHRPGPVTWERAREEQAQGVSPTGLRIEKVAIDAAVESLRVSDGQMPDPSGPWVVSWYENLGRLGTGDNVVMAGHIDYWNVGPSVFYNLAALQAGDTIDVFGDDGQDYRYAVDWVQQFDASTIDMDAVVGPTGADTLTLITCGGTFDYASGEYLQRTVVRADRVA